MTDLPSWGVAADSPTAEHYRTFGAREAAGSSATYEDWALGIADDGDMLALIDELPRVKRQANLVVVDCRIESATPPTRLPEVVWRGGIDLNPLDPADPDTLAWLDALVWPEHDDRRARLAAAARIAASDPAPIRAGDLNDLIADAAASAPRDATLVVFHTAVLAYLTPEDRERFRRTMADTDAVWLSNEGLGVFPEFERVVPPGERHRFVLAVDGEPVALTHPHGRSYRAL